MYNIDFSIQSNFCQYKIFDYFSPCCRFKLFFSVPAASQQTDRGFFKPFLFRKKVFIELILWSCNTLNAIRDHEMIFDEFDGQSDLGVSYVRALFSHDTTYW